MSARRSIEEFLAEVATRDLKQVLGHSYVFPKDDVAVRIREEVAAKTGCKVAQLLSDSPELLLSNRFVSARPEKFVSQTMARIGEVIDRLKKERAKTFDLLFVNPAAHSDPTHHWGDQAQMRVRFTK